MREREDGMLEATSFDEHMHPDVIWKDDPRYAEAFDMEAQGSGLEPNADNRPKEHGLGTPHGMMNAWPAVLGFWVLIGLLVLWATR